MAFKRSGVRIPLAPPEKSIFHYKNIVYKLTSFSFLREDFFCLKTAPLFFHVFHVFKRDADNFVYFFIFSISSNPVVSKIFITSGTAFVTFMEPC